MIAEHVAYVAAVSADVAGAAWILETGLGLVRTNVRVPGRGAAVPVFALGRSALALFSIGDPYLDGADRTGLHHVALACDAPADALPAARDAGIEIEGDAMAALGAGESVRLAAASTGAIRTRLVPPLVIERGGTFVERYDHIGVATDDPEAAIRCFCDRLGFAVESRQTDTEMVVALETFTSDRYGTVHHRRAPRQVGGGEVTFVTIGDTELELLRPFDLGPGRPPEVHKGTPGDTRQDMGALTRFVTGRGPGLHHLALKVPSTDDALARVRRAGGRTIDEVGRPGSRRARIGFVHPASLGGVLIHFDEREDPLRPAATLTHPSS